jgi:hypothetical protein
MIMKLTRIITQIKHWLSSAKSLPPTKTLPLEAMLARMAADTDEMELSCDEVLELLDRYVEMEASGEDAAALFPLVKRHLDRCRDCLEEYQALKRILKATPLPPEG